MTIKKALKLTLIPCFLLAALLGPLAGGATAQTWHPVYDSSPSTDFAATRSAGAAGSTLVNGWTDVHGGIWSTGSGLLTGTSSDTSGYLHNFLLRPTSENALAEREGETLGTGYTAASNSGVVLRYQSGGDNYLVSVGQTNTNVVQLTLFKNVSGAVSGVGSPLVLPSLNSAHNYVLTGAAVGASPTTLTATLTDTTTLSVVGTLSVTDSSSTLQSAGQVGMVVWAPTSVTNYSRVQTYNQTGPAATLAAAGPLTVGASSQPVTLTGTGTAWLTSAPTFTLSGGSGSRAVSETITSDTSATLYVNPGTTTGTLTVTDSSTGATATVTPSAQAATGQVVFVGDSLTYGTNASSGAGTVTGTTYPADAMAALGPRWVGTNLGVSGITLSTMISNAPSQASSTFDNTKAYHVAVILGGHNDYYNNGGTPATSATVYSRQTTLCGLWRSAGWRVVICTEPPAANPLYPTTFDALRDGSNALIRANWRTFADGLADLGGDALIGVNGDEYNTTYFSGADFTHGTDAGYAIYAKYAADQAAALGNASTAPSASGPTDASIQADVIAALSAAAPGSPAAGSPYALIAAASAQTTSAQEQTNFIAALNTAAPATPTAGSLYYQIVRIFGAEWGTVAPRTGGGYNVLTPGGTAVIGTAAPTYSGGVLQSDTKTVN